MARSKGRFALVSILGVAAFGGFALSQTPPLLPLPAHPSPAITPQSLLGKAIEASNPNAAQLNRGRYLVAAGDCMSCHLREGGEPFAGGLGLNTPFGTIYTSNITPDRATGIGSWTSDQFYRAMREGKGAHDENLYPAFPYPWFRHASRADDDAIFAYLMTLPP